MYSRRYKRGLENALGYFIHLGWGQDHRRGPRGGEYSALYRVIPPRRMEIQVHPSVIYNI